MANTTDMGGFSGTSGGCEEVVRRLEVLEEVVRRQGEKMRRLRQRPPLR